MAGSAFSAWDRWLLRRIDHVIADAPFQVVLEDGEGNRTPGSGPTGNIIVSDRMALAKLLLNPEVGFGDGYAAGTIGVDGELLPVLESALLSIPRIGSEGFFSKLFSAWLDRIQANTRRGSRRNISQHYDLPTDFYKLWLDARMVYTCAYFPSASATLEEAQLAKMDYVCRKIRLHPGDKVAEAGCGWGGLALHMAKHYGAHVKAFNISREQIVFARQRAKEEGLDGQVEFIEDDYRNIRGRFDAFVSVGMLEHVGTENYEELGRVVHRTIGDTGRGLLHFIGRNQPRPFSPWIRKHIFPGAYAPALRQALRVLEPFDFSILDIENLRQHYARTLEHWLARFERAAEPISRKLGPEFVRAWRLYLAGSAAAFRVGNLQLFQVVFAGQKWQGVPWTRAYLYEEIPPAKEKAKWMHAAS